jgi:MFS family permease
MLLSYPQFGFFWIARFATVLAQSSTVLAIGWQVYDISRQTLDVREASLNLGLIGLAQFLPVLAGTSVSGWVCDHIERLLVARLAVALLGLASACLGWLAWEHSQSLGLLYLLASLLGVVRAFYMPAMTATVSRLVPPQILPRAVAGSAMAGRAGAILGPLFGGLAFGVAPYYAFLLSFALICVSVIALSLIRPPSRPAPKERKPIWHEITAGIHYVRLNRLLLGVLSLDLFATLLGGVTALLPVYARDILDNGPSGLGLLRAAPAVGALSVAFFFSFRPLDRHVGRIMLGAVAVFGAGTMLFGVSRWMPLSLLLLCIFGAADMVSALVRQSMMQLTTPDSMRGRVGAISTLSVSTSNELGALESGLMAAAMGPVAAVIVSGALAVGVSLLWAKLFPEIPAANNFPKD